MDSVSPPTFPLPPLVVAGLLGALASAQVVLHPANLVRDLVLAWCATLPLAFVRGFLMRAAAVVTAAVLLTLVLGGQLTVGALLAQTASLYLVAVGGATRTALLFAVPSIGYAVATAGWRTMLVVVTAAGALAVGSARRSRTETAERVAADGAHVDLATAYAAREERARIARELHDLVAHHISSISVQADTTRLTTSGLPAESADRLLGIAGTARLALSEMRRVLGVLRDDAGAPPADAPQPGLGELITLVDDARATAESSVRLIFRAGSGRWTRALS
jgi:signal transduction histidine kinase